MAQPDALHLTRADLRDELARFMSFGKYTSAPTQAQADINAFIKRGLRQFYVPVPLSGDSQTHSWSFLQPWDIITTTAPYETGTISSSGTAITGSGTTFTSAMLGQKIIVGEQVRTIVTFTNSTTIVVDSAFSSNLSGSKYKIAFNIVHMSQHFGGLVGDLTYSKESTKSMVPNVGEASYRRTESLDPNKLGRPEIACVTPKDTADTNYPDNPSQFTMNFWPAPDDVYILQYRYVAVQGDETDTPTATFLGGAQHSETILVSCLSIAEEYAETPSTRYRELFQQRLAASILMDRRMNAPDNLGQNLDRSDFRSGYVRHGEEYTVRYYDISGNEVT